MTPRMGHIGGVSWFRTRPPFYQRMVAAQREIPFLPQKRSIPQQYQIISMKPSARKGSRIHSRRALEKTETISLMKWE